MSTQPFLQTSGLTKKMRSGAEELVILNQIDLDIAAGSTNAIVGASGSGKTTLLGLLAGLDLPSDGSVKFQGHALEAMSEDQRAQLRAGKVGFVFQSFQLLSHLTAYENVLLSIELFDKARAKQRTRDILQRVGLGARMHHYPNQMSGGEQQRCAIARAFVIDPILLFADEPTGNLDHNTGRQVIDLLFELNREHQTCLVIATHDDKLAGRCQQTIELEGGEIKSIHQGDHVN